MITEERIAEYQIEHTQDELDNYSATEELLDGWVESPWPSSYMVPTIHQSLLKGIEDYKSKGLVQRDPGVHRIEDIRVIREVENFYVKGTDVDPTVRQYYRDLDEILRNLPSQPEGNLEQIVQSAAWAYYCFERIHPFLDGNGRTGRMILNRILAGAGIEKIIFMDSWFAQERETHLDAMNLTDRLGSLAPLELYLADALSSKKSLAPHMTELNSIIEKKETFLLTEPKPQDLEKIWKGFKGVDIASPVDVLTFREPYSGSVANK